MRIIPSPRGPGRWQIWMRRRAGIQWTDWCLLGRYRTKLNARLVRWAVARNAANWGQWAEFEVRPVLRGRR